jgi:hypothetical protein
MKHLKTHEFFILKWTRQNSYHKGYYSMSQEILSKRDPKRIIFMLIEMNAVPNENFFFRMD